MNTNLKKNLLVLCFGLGLSFLATAGNVVIVHPSNSNNLPAGEIKKIFLGKKKSFPDGSPSKPVYQSESQGIRASFNKAVLRKSNVQIKAYWSRLVFSGKSVMPREAKDHASVKQLVAANPTLIGYIDDSLVDESVKVVHQF